MAPHLGGGDPVQSGHCAKGCIDVARASEHGLVQSCQQGAEDDQPRGGEDIGKCACIRSVIGAMFVRHAWVWGVWVGGEGGAVQC